MHTFRRMRNIGLASLLVAQLAIASPSHATTSHEGFNDEYVFATTRSVTNMEMNPALKLTLLPATVVLDVVFLPFALVAGLIA